MPCTDIPPRFKGGDTSLVFEGLGLRFGVLGLLGFMV